MVERPLIMTPAADAERFDEDRFIGVMGRVVQVPLRRASRKIDEGERKKERSDGRLGMWGPSAVVEDVAGPRPRIGKEQHQAKPQSMPSVGLPEATETLLVEEPVEHNL